MSGHPRSVVRGLVCGLALSFVGCDTGGETIKPDDSKQGGKKAFCTAENPEPGETLIAELRSQRASESFPGKSSFTDHRARLLEVCETGCGVACREVARLSATWDESREYHQKACNHGDSISCTLAQPPTVEATEALCKAGDALACAAWVSNFSGDAKSPFLRVAETAKTGCAANDGRSCSIEAWVSCVANHACDANAIAAATKAANLMPTSDILEMLAIVNCHAGQREDADATLAAACSAGHTDSCARRCEGLRNDRTMLVREADRAAYDRILLGMALQSNVAPEWDVAVSAMDSDELVKFEKALADFTPPLTEAGAAAEVPPKIREQFPEMVAAILRAPQLDAKQIRYWFKRLPEMTDEQRINLFESLRNQWWVLPGEVKETPGNIIFRVQVENGGFTPEW